MIKPYHDHLLVKLGEKSAFVTADEEAGANKGIRFGVVVSVPELEDMSYLATYTWVAEDTINNDALLDTTRNKMLKLVGKKVWWEERSDIGNEIEYEGDQYATIKFTKITAVEEEE